MDYVKCCRIPDTKVLVNLMAAQGKEPFYEKIGFQALQTKNMARECISGFRHKNKSNRPDLMVGAVHIKDFLCRGFVPAVAQYFAYKLMSGFGWVHSVFAEIVLVIYLL